MISMNNHQKLRFDIWILLIVVGVMMITLEEYFWEEKKTSPVIVATIQKGCDDCKEKHSEEKAERKEDE